MSHDGGLKIRKEVAMKLYKVQKNEGGWPLHPNHQELVHWVNVLEKPLQLTGSKPRSCNLKLKDLERKTSYRCHS